ncbi:MAG TPA: hypothetical protein VKE94_13195 [Gemmataceae bacterium]|nr:hypothetical protein [Gemmataceae bacterium]
MAAFLKGECGPTLVLGYDLEIIPVPMHFNHHDEVAFPLDAVDKEAVGRWIDDRIVEFVQTYFATRKNEIYLKDLMLEDPIAHVRFPKAAAATTLKWSEQNYYFIGQDTCREFEKQQGIGAK